MKYTISIPETLVDRVREKAKQTYRTNSGIFRIAVERYLGEPDE